MEALKKNHQRLISLKQAKKLVIILVAVFLFDFLLFSTPALANEVATEPDLSQEAAIIDETSVVLAAEPNFINQLPENSDIQVKSASFRVITVYNSEAGQCDSSPCITANGFNVCEHGIEDTVAANFLPFGAKVRIPELFGERIFIVRDRMNARYDNRLDIWMINKADAKQFGVKYAKVEILE